MRQSLLVQLQGTFLSNVSLSYLSATPSLTLLLSPLSSPQDYLATRLGLYSSCASVLRFFLNATVLERSNFPIEPLLVRSLVPPAQGFFLSSFSKHAVRPINTALAIIIIVIATVLLSFSSYSYHRCYVRCGS